MSRFLDMRFTPSTGSLKVDFHGSNGHELNLLFYGVLENALQRLGISQPLQGQFILESSLPVGTGLGASAALCGAVARWCEAQGWTPQNEVYEFARQLENLFHGESSGVDLAVSLSAQGLRFVRGGERTPIRVSWWPKLYLSYSGERGMTSDCVGKVKQLHETDPELALKLDSQMAEAVEMAEKALLDNSASGLQELIESIELAHRCFEKWGLSKGELGTHLSTLKEAGALAVKPTGSGGGGYALSLWDKEPPASIQSLLLSVPRPG
jgi:mevalonate kinase